MRPLAAIVMVGALATPAYAITIDWATVGDIGNAGDVQNQGTFGSVGYAYRISKHEVTNAQYVEFLNAVAADDLYALYNTYMGSSSHGGIVRSGSAGSYTYSVKPDAVGWGPEGGDYAYANKPVTYVSWFDAIRFANWLTADTTEGGVYTITGGGPNSGTVGIPQHETLGTDAYFLPSEDEWYKAAYYDPLLDDYYEYATSTDAHPNNNLPSADTGNSGNFTAGDHTTGITGFPHVDVGSYALSQSPYGTFDQMGSAWEWSEALIAGKYRGLRGGSWANTFSQVDASFRNGLMPTWESTHVGFRLASMSAPAVPEPSTYAMTATGLLGLSFLAWRRRAG